MDAQETTIVDASTCLELSEWRDLSYRENWPYLYFGLDAFLTRCSWSSRSWRT